MTSWNKYEAVVIGASAGGVNALGKILPSIPASYPLPIFIVVHIPSDSQSVLPELYAPRCQIQIKDADDKETIRPGGAYFAPPDYHLLIEPNGTLSLSSDEPELFSRPSIDVLFESAADAYGPGLIGIVLSGANEDGARGLRAIGDAGGLAIIQNPQTAEINRMPATALKACPGALVLDAEAISLFLAGLMNPTVTNAC